MKKVFYASCYPNLYLSKIRELSLKNLPLGGQTFNRLFSLGLKENECNVTVLVVYNISFDNKIFSKSFKMYEDGIEYVFFPNLKIPLLGTLFTAMYMRSYLKKEVKGNSDSDLILFYDVLLPYKYTVMKTFKKYHLKVVGIVTDLPEFFINNSRNIFKKLKIAIKRFLNQKAEQCISYYVLITKNMNKKVNLRKVPYVVIEGLSQKHLIETQDLGNNDLRTILYSGDLSKVYGIYNLIQAFQKIKIKNVELHLYGKCNYEDELSNICKIDNRIKFFGAVSVEELIKKQQQAYLLVNPRPLNLEFNKYSFPSKTIEYMSSGRPVLTTKLSGIPKDYYPYLYFTSGDSVDELYKSIVNLLKLDKNILARKGLEAKKYVDDNKNYIIQTKKVLEMIEEGNK